MLWLVTNWRLCAAGMALAAGLGLLGWERHQGAESVRKADAVQVVKYAQQIAHREGAAQAITDTSREDLAAQRIQIHDLTTKLQARAKADVPPSADDRCIVNAGFVRDHDAAAAGNPPELSGASSGPVEAASGVPLSAVLETVEGNYGVAYDWRSEALTWRAWYAKQAAEWAKR